MDFVKWILRELAEGVYGFCKVDLVRVDFVEISGSKWI